MEYSIKIGGAAGQGIQTVGETIGRVFSRNGYHVFTHQDYESRVRGGHNFFQIRVSDSPVSSSRERIDILVAFDKDSIQLYEKELNDDGVIIYDAATLQVSYDKPYFFDIPFAQLATDQGGSIIMANTVAIGAVLGILDFDLEKLFEIIKSVFNRKGEKVVQDNINAATAGKNFAHKNSSISFAFLPSTDKKPKLLINGADAVGFGAVASGCKFYSAYPMTPSTGVMNYLADNSKEHNIVVEQAEDEISAINMAIGASFAGVRAMTGSSGGGFGLMVEGISLAAMTETPVVIVLAQRPGPATGFPTRTEQGELLYVIHASHGEFPRVVFAPGSPEQAVYLTNKAFELAEKYQIQSFILIDQYLGDTQWTSEAFDLNKLMYNDYRLRGDKLQKLSDYKRHQFTDTGVNPLAIPGESRHLVVTDSDEHDEDGHIIEGAEGRIKMVQKRVFKKLPLITDEIEPPMFYGNKDPEIIISGWGSTYGQLKEAVDVLSKDGKKIAMLHFSEIYPFPSTKKLDYLNLLNKAKTTICVENNATGQFAKLMRGETGYAFRYRINKYDGRPFLLEQLVKEIKTFL